MGTLTATRLAVYQHLLESSRNPSMRWLPLILIVSETIPMLDPLIHQIVVFALALLFVFPLPLGKKAFTGSSRAAITFVM